MIGSSIVLAISALVFAAGHQAIYGGFTPYAAGSHFGGGELTVTGSHPDLVGRTQRLVGLLVDREFGLVAWAPVFLLAVPAVAALVRRCRQLQASGDDLARLRLLALGIPLLAGWANATWVALTMHGWWWPGRQVVVVVPCLALALAVWATDPAEEPNPSHARGHAWGQAPSRAWRRGRLRGMAVLGTLGLAAFAWQIAEVLTGSHALIVDFADTAFTPYRLWRLALPDFRHPSAATPWLTAAWSLGLAIALGARGARGARSPVANFLNCQRGAPDTGPDADSWNIHRPSRRIP